MTECRQEVETCQAVSLPLLDQVRYLPSRSALERFDFCVPQTKESSFGILKPFALRKSALAFGSGGEGNGDATLVFVLQTSPIWAKVMLFGSLLCLLLEISTSNPDAAHTARTPSGGLQSRAWCWQQAWASSQAGQLGRTDPKSSSMGHLTRTGCSTSEKVGIIYPP